MAVIVTQSGRSSSEAGRSGIRPNRKFLGVTSPSALNPQANMLCARRRGGRTPDITHLAISLIERRLKDAFLAIKYEVHGAQKNAAGAEALAAKDKHEFERWIIVGAIEGQLYRRGKTRRAWIRAIYH
jgi:hypothetical protein